jgi:hypothetical protein
MDNRQGITRMERKNMETQFLTSGQIAKKLRISISTLKRWIDDSDIEISDHRNYNGWRLFSEGDLDILKEYKRELRKKGRRFNDTTLIPILTRNSYGLKKKVSN